MHLVRMSRIADGLKNRTGPPSGDNAGAFGAGLIKTRPAPNFADNLVGIVGPLRAT